MTRRHRTRKKGGSKSGKRSTKRSETEQWRRQLASLDDAQVAAEYWKLPLDERTYRKVAVQFGLNGSSTYIQNRLGEKVRNAEKAGYVRHHVQLRPTGQKYEARLHESEEELRRRFGLRGAIVVATASGKPVVGPRRGTAGQWRLYDYKIHESLGSWARRVLLALVRPGDVVGVSGGRAAHWTVKDCMVSLPSGASTRYYVKKVVALAGQLSPTAWKGQFGAAPADFDADKVAWVAGTSLRAHDVDEVGAILRRDCQETAPADEVTLAVIGIGALTVGHRLFDEETRTRHELSDIWEDINRLHNLVKECESTGRTAPPFHHWVGDVLNHFFVTNDTRQHKLDDSYRRQLKEAAATLNEKLACWHPDVVLKPICQRGAVIAVAGGPHKASAVEFALSKGWVTHLITDDIVCDYLLR